MDTELPAIDIFNGVFPVTGLNGLSELTPIVLTPDLCSSHRAKEVTVYYLKTKMQKTLTVYLWNLLRLTQGYELLYRVTRLFMPC